jgi:hypothetical protein
MNRQLGNRRADLAIVVVIVALWIAWFVVTPLYYGPPRPTAAACLSNLKQIVLAQSMYAANHDERLPNATAWMDEIEPFVKSQDIYRCPALRKTPEAYGYAMNFLMSGVNSRKLSSPESTPLVFDSVLLVRNATSGFYGFPDPPRHGTAGSVDTPSESRRSRRPNSAGPSEGIDRGSGAASDHR